MARKLAACGTYAAARRHERRGETMDDACAEALRAYRADRQAARRSTVEHVVARAPGDLTVLPDGWTLWDGIAYGDRPRSVWAPRWESHIPEYAQTQVRLVDYPDYAALTGRHGSTVTVAAEVRLADLVAQWHADDPLVAARINMLDADDRADVLRVLGHGTWQTTTPSPDLNRIVTVHVSSSSSHSTHSKIQGQFLATFVLQTKTGCVCSGSWSSSTSFSRSVRPSTTIVWRHPVLSNRAFASTNSLLKVCILVKDGAWPTWERRDIALATVEGGRG